MKVSLFSPLYKSEDIHVIDNCCVLLLGYNSILAIIDRLDLVLIKLLNNAIYII